MEASALKFDASKADSQARQGGYHANKAGRNASAIVVKADYPAMADLMLA